MASTKTEVPSRDGDPTVQQGRSDDPSDTKVRQSVFAVPGMDCPSEESMIRLALDGQAGVKRLDFDLGIRRIAVTHQGDAESILERLVPLKLGARLVETVIVAPDLGAGGRPHSASDVRLSVFDIPKMDCASEEQTVRMVLEDLPAVRTLRFDLPARQLDVVHQGDSAAVLARLEPLGYGARLVTSQAAPHEAARAQPSSSNDRLEARTLWLLLAINAVMFAVEMVAGLVSESTGLIADSLDMLADALVYGLSLYAVGRAASLKLRAAHLSGVLQVLLAAGALFEVVRRFAFGSEPDAPYMMGIALVALAANVTALLLIAKHRGSGAHMKASWIFSANDVIANMGVIVAGALVAWTGSRYPDLVIGAFIAVVVLRGALRILRLRG